jgi:hypothetical protein
VDKALSEKRREGKIPLLKDYVPGIFHLLKIPPGTRYLVASAHSFAIENMAPFFAHADVEKSPVVIAWQL